MITITKTDAKKMRELGFTEYVKKTHTKHPTYYLVENYKALKAYKTLTKYHNI